MPLVLRCADVNSASTSVAALLGVDASRLQQALPDAVRAANRDPEDPIRALAARVADACGTTIQPPDEISYFHGTRVFEATPFTANGLSPLSDVLDTIWQQLAALAPEVSEDELGRLRADLAAGVVDPNTYPLRVGNAGLHGPNGHLILDPLIHPTDYGSVDYLAGAEIVIDICQAIAGRFNLNMTSRYREATRPCIVEFAMPPDHVEGAVASALWYLEAASRGERTTNAHWGYDGCGRSVPAAAIRDVTFPE